MFQMNLETDKYSSEVTAKEIYGISVSVPRGYKVVGFRPPKLGDNFINTGHFLDYCNVTFKRPRYILEKLKTKVFRSTGEFRTAKEGEWILWGANTLSKCVSNTTLEYDIFKLTEE